MYVYIYACMYVCMYVYIYIYIVSMHHSSSRRLLYGSLSSHIFIRMNFCPFPLFLSLSFTRLTMIIVNRWPTRTNMKRRTCSRSWTRMVTAVSPLKNSSRWLGTAYSISLYLSGKFFQMTRYFVGVCVCVSMCVCKWVCGCVREREGERERQRECLWERELSETHYTTWIFFKMVRYF
jgi:hypothetical protein